MATSATKRRVNIGLPNNSFSWSLAAVCVLDEYAAVYKNAKVVSRPPRRPIEGRQSSLTLVGKTDSERPVKRGIHIDMDE